MFEQIQNNEDIIVWIPFVVKKEHLQSPLMTASMPPQPRAIQQVVQEAPSALPPPPTHSVTPESKPRKGMASPKQKQFILEIVSRLNMAKDEMQRELGTRDIEQVTNAQANAFISKFKDAKPVF